MSGDITLIFGERNGSIKRALHAVRNGIEIHRDVFDTDSAYLRRVYAIALAERLRPTSQVPTDADRAAWNPDDGGPGAVEIDVEAFADRILIEADQFDAEQENNAEDEGAAPKFKLYTSRELDELEFNEAAIIENAKVEGQPGGVFGGTKTLKTCVEADGVISVATATNFLNCEFFRVPRARRVMFMSAESGLKAMQRLARRIASGRGFELSEIENILWCPTVPFIGDDRDCMTIGKIIKDNAIEWAVFDPLYMMADGREANNLYAQGAQFQRLKEACFGNGADFDVLHHTTRAAAKLYDPPTLNDAQWSGISEFVGQWCILGRRGKYLPGSGRHELWLELGARGEFQNSWAIDVDEHSDTSGRPQGWSVTVRPAAEVQGGGDTGDRSKERDEARERDIERAMSKIVQAAIKFPNGETEKRIRGWAGLDGGAVVKEAFARLLNDGSLEEIEIVKPNRKTPYPGFRIVTNED
jgi:hypothetical protein